jgi:hypothetical protein
MRFDWATSGGLSADEPIRFRYKLNKVYYLKIAGTDEYQFIKPDELKALGYDFDSLYQPE